MASILWSHVTENDSAVVLYNFYKSSKQWRNEFINDISLLFDNNINESVAASKESINTIAY